LKTGLGSFKVLEMAPFDRSHTSSYSPKRKKQKQKKIREKNEREKEKEKKEKRKNRAYYSHCIYRLLLSPTNQQLA